ncbi:MAG: hypothetical protein F6J97_20790 [Leptolyngbya sp. SIO4C1]|nr:hypothetical protein [Leptolyngbya sp. SIO4C1]
METDIAGQQPDSSGQGAPYSAVQLAEELNIGDSTIRKRWFQWLLKVAPEPLLKTADGYTELARTLFHEFAKVDQRDRKNWVTDAKARYSAEWDSAGIIEGELMPPEVGGALAILQTANLTTQAAIDQELADLDGFIDQLNEAEANFSAQELATFKLAGVKRGAMRFKIEAQAEAQTYNHLRQQRMQGGTDA